MTEGRVSPLVHGQYWGKLRAQFAIMTELVMNDERYGLLYSYLWLAYRESGGSFKYCTPNGSSELRLGLEVQRNTFGVGGTIDLYTLLQRLTYDYGLAAGLSKTEWNDLILYLSNSYQLIQGNASGTAPQPETVKIIQQEPWLLCILLLEVLPDTHELFEIRKPHLINFLNKAAN